MSAALVNPWISTASGAPTDSPIFTGSAGFADGTVTVPSIAWTSDADGTGTGLYRRAANCVSVALNGVVQSEFNVNVGLKFGSTMALAWTAGDASASADTSAIRAGANSILFGAGAAATTNSRTEMNKATTAIANAVATTVVTFTVPNAAHSASFEIQVIGSLGAGGAIGANEASASNTYVGTLCRTAGVATVVTLSSAYGAAASAVAGAATVTCTAAATAMSGAVGATQTFDIQVTISRSGGSSTNHTCQTYVRLMNSNVTGVTVA